MSRMCELIGQLSLLMAFDLNSVCLMPSVFLQSVGHKGYGLKLTTAELILIKNWMKENSKNNVRNTEFVDI